MAIHSIPCVPDKLPPGLDFDNSCYFKIEENPSGSSNYPSWSLLSSFRGRPWAGVKLKLTPDLQVALCEPRSSKLFISSNEKVSPLIYFWEWDPISLKGNEIQDKFSSLCSYVSLCNQINTTITKALGQVTDVYRNAADTDDKAADVSD